MVNILSPGALIVSLRDLARDATVRRRALKENRPVIVEQSRENSYFVLLPPALYNELFELYRDMRDAQELQDAMQQPHTEDDWVDWADLKRELRQKKA
jgi:predicted peptidase